MRPIRTLPLVLLFLAAAAPDRVTDRLADRLDNGAPIVCAHRGWLAPDRAENSLATMRETEARGPFMLEMDLAVTRDGRIVLMHDPDLRRTTTGSGAVAALDAASVGRTRLRPRDAVATGEAPPLFDAVLDWAVRTPGTLLMLDLKRTPPALAMAAVRRAGLRDRVVLLCFDPATEAAAFAADPAVAVSALVRSEAELAAVRRLAGRHKVLAYVPLDSPASLFAHARAAGMPVITDLLDPHDAFRERFGAAALADRPVSIVVTNHPEAVRAALATRAAPGASAPEFQSRRPACRRPLRQRTPGTASRYRSQCPASSRTTTLPTAKAASMDGMKPE